MQVSHHCVFASDTNAYMRIKSDLYVLNGSSANLQM